MKTFKNNKLYMEHTFNIVKELCDKREIECNRISETEFTINMEKIREIKAYDRPMCLDNLTLRKDGF